MTPLTPAALQDPPYPPYPHRPAPRALGFWDALRASPLRFALLFEYMCRAYADSGPSVDVRGEVHALCRALGVDAAQVRALEEWARDASARTSTPSPRKGGLVIPETHKGRLIEAGIPMGALAASVEACIGHANDTTRAASEGASERRSGLSRRVLERVTDYVDDHLHQKLMLSELADVAGLSVSHFKTLFRRSTQVPAHRYVMQRRVERARILLEQGKPIVMVALDAGFTDASHLARWMRRCLGVTPSQVLKRGC